MPIATVVGYSRAVNAESPMSHPQRFIASGCDKDALESVRSDWKIRNQGIGLRDVRYLRTSFTSSLSKKESIGRLLIV